METFTLEWRVDNRQYSVTGRKNSILLVYETILDADIQDQDSLIIYYKYRVITQYKELKNKTN